MLMISKNWQLLKGYIEELSSSSCEETEHFFERVYMSAGCAAILDHYKAPSIRGRLNSLRV